MVDSTIDVALERVGFGLAAALRLEGELARWRRLSMRPRLWWRDDDARAPSPALDRLLSVAAGRPLALAVIPDGDLAMLAGRLRGERNVSVGQHGVDHVNRRPEGTRPSEYTGEAGLGAIALRVGAGQARMTAAGLKPSFYTPPWNAVEAGLAEALAQMGVSMLSAGGDEVAFGSLDYMAAEIDVLRWKGGARFKGAWRLAGMLAQALAERRGAGDFARPIGLLTHHLAHDEATWRYLERAMPWLDARFDWVSATSPRQIVPRPQAQPMRAIDAMAEMQHV